MEALLLGAGLLLGAYVLVYYNLVKAPPCGGIGSLRGRTAVVTGANSGIGKMTALELARRGARVVLACRSRERGEAAAFDLRQGVGTMRSIFMALDLAVLASVRAFATAFLRSEPRLDILIHNAGEGSCGRTERPLTYCSVWWWYPQLPHRRGSLDFTRLDRPVWAGSKSCGHMPTGKLANVLFARELATQLEGTGVTCYAAHPGPVNSELFLRHVPGWLRPLLRPLAWLVLRAPKGGAQTPLYCALQEGIEPLSGRYFANCHVEEVPPAARDDRIAHRLWEASMRLAGLGPGEDDEPDEELQPEDPGTPFSPNTTHLRSPQFVNLLLTPGIHQTCLRLHGEFRLKLSLSPYDS
uniref:Dehydrogenase/reductase 13 n=1 Tax=Sciurus vulgaris TaxID=55149 RepID=A0A8D2DLD6_SCIVU